MYVVTGKQILKHTVSSSAIPGRMLVVCPKKQLSNTLFSPMITGLYELLCVFVLLCHGVLGSQIDGLELSVNFSVE